MLLLALFSSFLVLTYFYVMEPGSATNPNWLAAGRHLDLLDVRHAARSLLLCVASDAGCSSRYAYTLRTTSGVTIADKPVLEALLYHEIVLVDFSLSPRADHH